MTKDVNSDSDSASDSTPPLPSHPTMSFDFSATVDSPSNLKVIERAADLVWNEQKAKHARAIPVSHSSMSCGTGSELCYLLSRAQRRQVFACGSRCIRQNQLSDVEANVEGGDRPSRCHQARSGRGESTSDYEKERCTSVYPLRDVLISLSSRRDASNRSPVTRKNMEKTLSSSWRQIG